MREYALTIGKKNFFTFGEIPDPDPEADFINFIGRNTKQGNDLNSPVGVDAAMDYPLYNTLVPAVRETLWGLVPGFPQNTSFYPEMQKIVAIRQSQPSLRYGRFYFRPISGDHINFAVSAFPNGIMAWSRIINDQEVLTIANTNTTQSAPPLDVILEITLSTPGQPVNILYSNKTAPINPGPVTQLTNVVIAEPNGTTGTGPVNTTRVTLQPMEVQILRVQF
jgi:hypothetical protein